MIEGCVYREIKDREKTAEHNFLQHFRIVLWCLFFHFVYGAVFELAFFRQMIYAQKRG